MLMFGILSTIGSFKLNLLNFVDFIKKITTESNPDSETFLLMWSEIEAISKTFSSSSQI